MRFSEETIISITAIVGVLLLLGGFLALSSWDEQQVRMLYQQAYTKNMECRTTSSKGTAVYNLEKVCGPVPNFEDYQNK
jgi:hypothetical protein